MRSTDRGFTLVEVVFATGLALAIFAGVAQAFSAAARAGADARTTTLATIAAVEKMEQLHALPLDDPALLPSPPGALVDDLPGYFDLPLEGYVRRWSIEPLAGPPGAVAINVVVRRDETPAGARLVTIRTGMGT